MMALIPDEQWIISDSLIFILLIKTQQFISGTSASNYKVIEPFEFFCQTLQELDGQTFRTNTEHYTLSPKWTDQIAQFHIADIRLVSTP